MSFDLREKLFGISVVLILIAGLPSGLYLERQLRGWIVEGIETDVLRHARATRTLLHSSDPAERPRSMDPLADRMGEATGARITIIELDGRVLGDSELSLEGVRTVENHASRPEIQQALADGRGFSRRHSTTVNREMFYVALPYGRPERSGVVRASLPLAEVGRHVRQLRLFIGAAALFGLVVAIFMSGLVSHSVTRNLSSLVSRARSAIRAESGPAAASSAPVEPEESSLEELSAQLERAVDKLVRQRDRLEAILESMAEAVIVVDRNCTVDLVNSAAADLLELEDDPTGSHLSAAVDHPKLDELCERARQGERPTAEVELDGEPERYLDGRAAREPTTGGIVIVLHDVTELRRLERVRSDFVANVSHELRTPVSIIHANAETLKNGALDDPEHGPKFVDSLLRTSERMSDLIDDLLELSRLEANEHDLELDRVKLRPIVDRSLENVRPRAAEREFDIELQVDGELTARADPKAVEQVLRNFAENAVKYMNDGGRVCIRAYREEDGVVVAVEDDGPGIPEEDRDRIFERFYRVDAGRSRDEGGTGLGLAISKHLVQNMGGEIGYRPAEDGGSIFWFRLPPAPELDG